MSQLEAFTERARSKLTEAQFDVVREHGRGPVKVAAAAGSGKTTTMAWLYAAALVSDLPVSRIMAVTFTERAAGELRRKVLDVMIEAEIVPPDATGDALEGSWIGTFHQLVLRLLRERAYLAGLPRDLTLIEEVEAEILIQEALTAVRQAVTQDPSWLERLPRDPDPRTVRGLFDGAAVAARRLRSTELEPSDCVRESLGAYPRWLARGDPPEELAWHRAALNLATTIWQEYERRLKNRGSLDFDGLLRAGLGALRRSPTLLEWCRSNFRLVIVDEFQDTSELQEALIHQLTGPDHRSLFMVGDARQSIYAFRDAKPGIMADSLGRRFGLFRNHRSRVPILQAADYLIKADPNFADDEAMEAARGQESGLPVWVAEVADPRQEAEAIASALDQIHGAGITYPDGSHHAVLWQEMAVLAYTQRSIGRPLEEAFRRRGIPFQTVKGGLLDRPEVRDMVAVLRLTVDERDDLACLRVLQSHVVRLPDRALVALAGRARHQQVSFAQRLRIHLEAGAPGWEPSWAERARWILSVVDSLRHDALTSPAALVLEQAMAESGLLRLQQARVLKRDAQARRGLDALRELQRVAWAAESPARWLSLGELVAQLDLMQRAADSPEPPPQTDEDLVTISTIHRAKGLEWRVVVLADCRPFHRRGQASVMWDREERAVLCTKVEGRDTSAFAHWKASPAYSVDPEEHRRLVYVAMTRARDLLVVTTSRSGKDGEFAQLAEAATGRAEWASAWPQFGVAAGLPWPSPGFPEVKGHEPVSTPAIGPASVPLLVRRWEELERARAELAAVPPQPQQLSFTAIDVLQHCPRQYWYQYLARFPGVDETGGDPADELERSLDGAGRQEALNLGLAVHRVLERLHTVSRDAAPTPLQAISELERIARDLNPEQRALADEMVLNYLAGPAAALPTVATEIAFSWTGWAGPGCPPLVGVIDRVARLESGELMIIDYKTNLALSPTEVASYSRQLQLYAAAVAAGVMGAPVTAPATALAMLRTGELLTVSSGPEDLEAALSWARAAAGRVRAGEYRSVEDFPERPCARCPFVERCPERREEGLAPLFGQLKQA